MISRACCGGGMKGLVSRKLGRCAACMRGAALGALAAWAVFAGTNQLELSSIVSWLALAAAVALTLLLIVHAAAFVILMWKSAADLPQAGESYPGLNRPQYLDRSSFSVGLLGWSLTALAASVVGFRPLPLGAPRRVGHARSRGHPVSETAFRRSTTRTGMLSRSPALHSCRAARKHTNASAPMETDVTMPRRKSAMTRYVPISSRTGR